MTAQRVILRPSNAHLNKKGEGNLNEKLPSLSLEKIRMDNFDSEMSVNLSSNNYRDDLPTLKFY